MASTRENDIGVTFDVRKLGRLPARQSALLRVILARGKVFSIESAAEDFDLGATRLDRTVLANCV